MTQRLADEQANVSLFAFGVGRGVDKVTCGSLRQSSSQIHPSLWHCCVGVNPAHA